MLKEDIFAGADKISKDHFMTIRGDSPERNAFWRVISQVAVEKFNMKEVFNMESSVRLTAIEKLGGCGKGGVGLRGCGRVGWGYVGVGGRGEVMWVWEEGAGYVGVGGRGGVRWVWEEGWGCLVHFGVST